MERDGQEGQSAKHPRLWLGLLDRLTVELGRPQDLDTTLGRCLDLILHACRSEAGSILLDTHSGGSRVVASRGGSALPGERAFFARPTGGESTTDGRPAAGIQMESSVGVKARQSRGELLCVPICAGGSSVGFLNVVLAEGRGMEQEESRLLQVAADLIGMATDRAKLHDAERERQLIEVARTLSSTLDLPTVLTSVVGIASDLIDSEGGALALVSEDGQTITYPYVFNLPEGLSLAPTPRGHGIAWRCVETGESLLLSDYGSHPQALARWVEAGIHGFISVPVVAGDERIGALGLFSLRRGRGFGKRDLAIAEAIGRQAGIAIQNARRYEATKRQVEELKAMHALSLAGAELRSADELIRHAIHTAAAALDADCFCLGTMDPSTGRLTHHPASIVPEDCCLITDEGREGLEEVFRSSLSRRIGKAAPEAAAKGSGGVAVLSVPMRIGDRTIGTLSAGRRRVPSFSADDERFLVTFAGQLATALDRLRASDELRRSEERFRLLAENAQDVIYRYRLWPDRGFDYVSPAVLRACGYTAEEHYGDPGLLFRLIHEDDRHLLRHMTSLDPSHPLTLRWQHRNGKHIWMEHRSVPIRDESGRLVAIEGIARDITERKHLEEQLRQSQKMEAIGSLAGGIAHDFNNLLTVILSYSSLQLGRMPAGDPMRRSAEEIRKAGERAAALTRQLLAFGRKQLVEPKVLDLPVVVLQMAGMLRSLIGERIDLRIINASSLGTVRADRLQIEQILLNLTLNSRDAMPQGGVLCIGTSDVCLDEAFGRSDSRANRGPWVRLTVTDSGCGMDEATLSRVYEPFFTTKERGKGTGLGLSTVYAIVQQSGGTIRVRSQPGRGTSFEVFFPLAFPLRTSAIPPPQARPGVRGTETILLVEDEPDLRALVAELLELDGYRVLQAESGEAAIDASTHTVGPIHLLLTDVVMPGMSGRVLAEALAKGRPRMRVLYTSGHTDDEVIRQGLSTEQMAFLQKPFTREVLAAKVRDVLDAAVHAAG